MTVIIATKLGLKEKVAQAIEKNLSLEPSLLAKNKGIMLGLHTLEKKRRTFKGRANKQPVKERAGLSTKRSPDLMEQIVSVVDKDASQVFELRVDLSIVLNSIMLRIAQRQTLDTV